MTIKRGRKVAVKKVAKVGVKKVAKKVAVKKVAKKVIEKNPKIIIKSIEIGKEAIVKMNDKIARKLKAIAKVKNEPGFYLDPRKYPVTIAKCKQIQVNRLNYEIVKLKKDIDCVVAQMEKLSKK